MGVDKRFDTRGAAGAVKRPAFRTSPWGKTDENEGEDRHALEPDKTRGDESRSHASERDGLFDN
jgi:hypothetical protein